MNSLELERFYNPYTPHDYAKVAQYKRIRKDNKDTVVIYKYRR
jgi:hypothetical protein